MPPLVTIGIPVHNCARYVGEALASALAQTYRDLEVLVIDNASTDGTLGVVEAFDDPRLAVLRNETNIGAGRNWNRVLTEARGRYVKVLSADDTLEPECIERQVEAMEAHPSVVLVTGRRAVVGADGERLTTRGPGSLSGKVAGAAAVREMVRTGTNLVGEPSTALIRGETLARSGLFDESAPYCVDMDLWFRLLQHGDLFAIDATLGAYRVAPGSWSMAVMGDQTRDVIELLERTAAGQVAGVTRADARRGARRARANSWMRRALYAVLATTWMRRMLYAALAMPAAHRGDIEEQA